jgi:Zn-dependent peptidase ImmA (M78 family)
MMLPCSETLIALADALKVPVDYFFKSNVIELLERNNIKIIGLDVSSAFDGLSTIIRDIPIIVINKRFVNVRKRFTALNELAHLVFRFPGEYGPKEMEKMCHYFAGAFLIPKEALDTLYQEFNI